MCAGGGGWKFEASLGQSLSVDVDAASVGLTDTVSDVVTLRLHAATGLLSTHDSSHDCVQLKVCQHSLH